MSSTGEFFDIGGTTSEALERFEGTGEPYPGSTDPHAAGNGSIMRLAPVPLFYARAAISSLADDSQPPEALERCAESSRTTHGGRAAVDACRYLGALIVGAVNGASKEEILSEHYTPFNGYWETRPLVREIDEIARGSFKLKEPPEIRGSGYVVASLEAALWAFHNSDSFEEGALMAVNLGDDADTTGAVYGQLAGAYYGENGIPKPWRRKLAHRLLIEHFADKLLRLGITVDWDKLLKSLPIFERPDFVFAEKVTSPGYTMGNPDTGSYMEIPYSEWTPEVEKFHQALYDTGVVFPFDWSEWQEEARRFVDEPAALAEADEATLRKLLTLHARVDRFNEGHFIQMLESGHITAILRRVEALRKTL